MSEPLLSYALVTSPQPLVAGESGEISIIASNNIGDFVRIGQISVTLPGPGDAAEDLSNQSGSFSTSVPAGWLDATDQTHPYTIIFKPDTATNTVRVGIDGLEFQIEGIDVNAQPGIVNLTISETHYEGDNSKAPQIGTTVLSCTKADAEFSLGPLVANPPTLETGESTVLEWSATGAASYTLEPAALISVPEGGLAPGVPVNSAPLSSNTVFTLTATSSTSGSYLDARQAYVSVALPEVTRFAASATSVAPGHSITLSWSTQNATSVVLYANSVAIAQTDQVNCDAFPVTPEGSTQYEIIAVFGAVDSPNVIRSSASLPVAVTIKPPQIINFAPTQDVLYADTPAKLAWRTAYADVVLLEDQNGTLSHVPLSASAYEVDGHQSQTWKLHAFWLGAMPDSLSANDAFALAKARGIGGSSHTTTLNYVPSPLLFAVQNGLKDGDTATLDFLEPVDEYIVGVAGFEFKFNSGDAQQFQSLYGGASITDYPATDGTSLGITASLQINNHSNKVIDSDCVLDVIGVARRKNDTAASLNTSIAGPNQTIAMLDYGVDTPLLGLSYFQIVNDHSHRISGIDLDAGTVTGSPPVWTLSTLQSNVYDDGNVDDRYSDFPTSCAAISTPTWQPCGFEVQIKDWGAAFATFNYPVQDAAIIIQRFTNLTDGSNHNVGRIWSNTVTGTVDPSNAQQLNLDWGDGASGMQSAGFDNYSASPWYGNTKILIIARYAVPGSS